VLDEQPEDRQARFLGEGGERRYRSRSIGNWRKLGGSLFHNSKYIEMIIGVKPCSTSGSDTRLRAFA